MNAASAIHLGMFGLMPLVKHGSEDLKRRHLPRAISGELHVSFAVTEPDAGNDITHIKTFARRDGDNYIVNGRKVFITKAQESSKMLLLTRTTPIEQVAKKTDGMTLFFADIDRDAVEVRELHKLGRHAVDTNMLFIDNLKVSASDMVGKEGGGFRILIDGLNPERILLASESVGMGRSALDRAVKYAKERIVFGRPIGQNQGIQFPIARNYIETEAAALMVDKAANLFDAGEPRGTEANIAKLLASEASWRAADVCLQTHGGFGFAEEFDIERKFRETRLYQIAPVSTNLILSHVGTHVLKMPKSF